MEQIWNGNDPLKYGSLSYADNGYPHTNLNEIIIHALLDYRRPLFWLELGSMLGGSAIRTAVAVKSKGLKTSIVCGDPFTGDVNMMVWEHESFLRKEWRFLRNEDGRPRIYDRFLANVLKTGHSDIIVPVVATSLVVMKSFLRLFNDKRLLSLPQIIYLDSAHELGETLLELRVAWSLLPEGGVLFGDDWGWPAVRTDVSLFGKEITYNALNSRRFCDGHSSLCDKCAFLENIFVCLGQWLIFK